MPSNCHEIGSSDYPSRMSVVGGTANDTIDAAASSTASDGKIPPHCVSLKKKSLALRGYNSFMDWNLDPNHIYIGRSNVWVQGAVGSKWQNPFPSERYGLHKSVELFEEHVRKNEDLLNSIIELEGKEIGCWCKPSPCHGDVLVKLFKQLHVDHEHFQDNPECSSPTPVIASTQQIHPDTLSPVSGCIQNKADVTVSSTPLILIARDVGVSMKPLNLREEIEIATSFCENLESSKIVSPDEPCASTDQPFVSVESESCSPTCPDSPLTRRFYLPVLHDLEAVDSPPTDDRVKKNIRGLFRRRSSRKAPPLEPPVVVPYEHDYVPTYSPKTNNKGRKRGTQTPVTSDDE